MGKRPKTFSLVIAAVVFLLIAQGCAMGGTGRLVDDVERRNRLFAEKNRWQVLGLKKNETDCYTIYKAEAEECGYSLTMHCKQVRRAMRRIGRIQPCHTSSNPEKIKEVMRDLGRRR